MTDNVREFPQVARREPLWRRILAPHSYNPATGATYVRPLYRLDVHVPALVNRLRWRYMAWQQRSS